MKAFRVTLNAFTGGTVQGEVLYVWLLVSLEIEEIVDDRTDYFYG